MPGSTYIRVMIAGEMRLARDLFRCALTHAPDMEVVSEADSIDGIAAAGAKYCPDVALISLMFGNMAPAEAVGAYLKTCPTGAAVVVVPTEEYPGLFDALDAGACGYVLLTQSVTDLAEAVRHAAAHEAVLSPRFARKMLERMRNGTPGARKKAEDNELTDRETEVLKLVAAGLANEAVGRYMHISASTVKNHLYNVFRKLEVSNRSQAVAEAYRRGLISREAPR